MSQVQQIKEATSISQIIGERVPLMNVGRHSRCCCPFHGEKTPSFYVTEDLGYYKCFGCGKAGDVFTFLEEYEGMTFREALEYLADRLGIKLEDNFAHKKEDDEKQILLNILAESSSFYQGLLKNPTGRKASEYLAGRKTSHETARLFGLGASSENWDDLTKFLRGNKKFREEELIKAGVTIKSQKNGRLFDRFRSRLMFPLKNHRGQVVGFSGRWLGAETEKEAKYINSPETTLYQKRELLFGLAENLPTIKREKTIILVEGEFDCLSSVQAEVNNVAAIKGSALTAEHIKLLKRYVNKVILALDMDKAGIEATRKAAAMLKKEEIELRVAMMPAGKDPDELAKENRSEWREVIKKAVSVYDYFLTVLQKKYDAETIEGKKQIVGDMAGFINQIDNAIEKDYYVKKLAEIIKVKQSLLESDLGLWQKKTDTALISARQNQQSIGESAKKEKRASAKEMWLLCLLFNSPAGSIKKKIADLEQDSPKWTEGKDRTLVENLKKWTGEYNLQKFARSLADDLATRLAEITMNREFNDEINVDSEWKKQWTMILKMKINREIGRADLSEEEREKLLKRRVELEKN